MYQLIKLSFGTLTYKVFTRITRISKNIVKLLCRINFLNKCESSNIIPPFLKLKASVNSVKDNHILTQSSRNFMLTAISLNHNSIKSLKFSLNFNIVQMNLIIPMLFSNFCHPKFLLLNQC